MTKTVTCLFKDISEASSTVRELENIGIDRDDICLFSNSGDNRFWSGTSSFDQDRSQDTSLGSDNHIERYLSDNGVPADDAHAYAEGVRRGHALVAVRCDDDEVDQVVDILDGDHALDLDERQNTWRSEGWTSYGTGMETGAMRGNLSAQDGMDDDSIAASGSGMMRDHDAAVDRTSLHTQAMSEDRGVARDQEEVIPVAEEELHVGKRAVNRGRVRILSHVVERPVHEQVALREERVEVERRPAEGHVRTGMGEGSELFQERSVEVEERGEEAVVSKEARVVEEVAVRKHVDEHTENISDTVRKTEIEVEDERGHRISRTGTTDDER